MSELVACPILEALIRVPPCEHGRVHRRVEFGSAIAVVGEVRGKDHATPPLPPCFLIDTAECGADNLGPEQANARARNLADNLHVDRLGGGEGNSELAKERVSLRVVGERCLQVKRQRAKLPSKFLARSVQSDPWRGEE
jgi:hypothetical protein